MDNFTNFDKNIFQYLTVYHGAFTATNNYQKTDSTFVIPVVPSLHLKHTFQVGISSQGLQIKQSICCGAGALVMGH